MDRKEFKLRRTWAIFSLALLVPFLANAQVEANACSNLDSSIGAAIGIYHNVIPDITPPEAYTEICFKDGSTNSDVHVVSEDTKGGSCKPGDIGFIVEHNERSAASFKAARLACLQLGLRLLEPFEFQVACVEDVSFGLLEMRDNYEWSSNATTPFITSSVSGVGVSAIGNGNCVTAKMAVIAASGGASLDVLAYRCAR